MFVDKNFLSFGQMIVKYKIPKKEFWKHLQLRSSVKSSKSKVLLISQPVIQEMVQVSLLVKGRAFRFYKLMRKSHAPKLKGFKRAWEI